MHCWTRTYEGEPKQKEHDLLETVCVCVSLGR